MTISNNYAPTSVSGDNSTVVFSGNWPIFVSSYLKLEKVLKVAPFTRTTMVLGTDYTLSFNSSGWVATFISGAPSNLVNVVGSRVVPPTQTLKYSTSSGFDGTDQETSYDLLTAMVQGLQETLLRVPQLAVGSALIGVLLGAPVANKALLWSADGTQIITSTDDFNNIVTLATAQATIATSAATAASGSASTAGAAATAAAASALAAQQAAASITLPLAVASGGTGGTTTTTALNSLASGINGSTYGGTTIDGANDAIWFYSNSATAGRKLAFNDVYRPIHGLSAKTTPVNADEFVLIDSANSNAPAKITFANLKAAITTGGTAIVSVKTQRFTSSGTYTPSTGMLYCRVRAIGGGGGATGGSGGPNYGSGGGAGAYCEAVFTAATISTSQSVTIGAAGTAASGTSTATAGGTTSLGSLISVGGGSPGSPSPSSITYPGGVGGAVTTAPTGSISYPGQPGGAGQSTGSLSGFGGSTVFGVGGYGVTSGTAGNAGQGYGAGGSGANSTNSGGAGAAGVVYIEEFCSV